MLRYVKSGMMLMSIAYIVLGLMLLIMPETSLLWICYAFGVVVLITGIVCLIQYARIRGTGFTAPFMLVGGVITAGLGLFTLAKPQVVASFLPVVFGIFIVVDGCSRIGSAIDLAKRKGEKWWMLLLFSIVSIALGALLIWHPFGAAVSVVIDVYKRQQVVEQRLYDRGPLRRAGLLVQHGGRPLAGGHPCQRECGQQRRAAKSRFRLRPRCDRPQI